ncbi:hypothetical protein BC940DRAFT_329358 [Gongronella butleri]|nr:hypothetical protein BC940DRAFT_329358 [Gongronella butleri]
MNQDVTFSSGTLSSNWLMPAETVSSDMLRALHHDERELRHLVVILSLTGGLVLSFLLGVGIFIYWHWRAWSHRRRKRLMQVQKGGDIRESKDEDDGGRDFEQVMPGHVPVGATTAAAAAAAAFHASSDPTLPMINTSTMASAIHPYATLAIETELVVTDHSPALASSAASSSSASSMQPACTMPNSPEVAPVAKSDTRNLKKDSVSSLFGMVPMTPLPLGLTIPGANRGGATIDSRNSSVASAFSAGSSNAPSSSSSSSVLPTPTSATIPTQPPSLAFMPTAPLPSAPSAKECTLSMHNFDPDAQPPPPAYSPQ